MHTEEPTTETCPPRDTLSKSSDRACSVPCRTSYTALFNRIHERMDARDHAAAQRLLRYVDKLYPDNVFIKEQIAFTAEALGDWEMVCNALLTLLDESDDTDEIGDLVFHSVRLLVTRLNRPANAMSLIRRHFIPYIRQPGCIEWTKTHLVEGAYHDPLIELAESVRATSLSSADHVHLCNALGSWYATSATDWACASRWYRKALRMAPGNPEAIDGLLSLHRQHRQPTGDSDRDSKPETGF